jgi:hypothetical protein
MGMIRLGLPVIVLLIGTAWFGWVSYRRAVQAEQTGEPFANTDAAR